ncbi:MAG: ribonuclease R [Porticoccus sp.]
MKKHINKDFFSQREAAKYDNPIPSREYILDFLAQSRGPLTHDELCEELGISDERAYEAIRRRLIAMERDGQLIKNRSYAYGALEKMNLIKGRVIGHPDGFGFVSPVVGETDLYLSSRQMKKVLDGDEVLVRISGKDHRGRQEATIVEVVEHRTSSLVGRFFVESNTKFVRPDNPKISQDIIIPVGQENNAEPGQIVIVKINQQPSKKHLPTGCVTQILGSHMAPGMEIDIAINNYGIPVKWPDEVLNNIDSIGDSVSDKDKKFRIDLRHLPFVTIDGEDARDFDDAVYCEPESEGFRKLYVAIADVSHYVSVATALDQEANKRGNSVYFPQYVVPMLPEEISNGLCSLKPNLDRLTLVCEMMLDKNGAVIQYSFFEGLINSHARLTYTQVTEIISQRKLLTSSIRKQFNSIIKNIDALTDLYYDLLNSRKLRGAIEFESQESQIIFDKEKKIKEILPVQRNSAHRLIEECMLCANVCAAKFLKKNKISALYRVHQGPKDEKIESLREFLDELGIDFTNGGADPKDFQRILNDIQKRPDGNIIQSVILRSMNRAVYSPESHRHFGLNYPEYTHFTSPIRRYPDLLVHRAIRYLIRKKSKNTEAFRENGSRALSQEEIYPYDKNQLSSFGEHCSLTERRADEATRDVVNWLKCEFLSSRVGEQFDGTVSTVTGFGLFVQLDDMYIEGLIHITSLPKDYYQYEEDHHRLVGEKTGKIFRLGDNLKVKVIRVELNERKIDFELIEKNKGTDTKKSISSFNRKVKNKRKKIENKIKIKNSLS